ncbi:cupin domain-containing protein [Gimesia fumaroli]|uniref:Cupin domain protein n=1 Tax=Gimesia fumaroli TaxID=2527976 RepID=A0A518I7R0_9PLAN|nr:cupin domain-containing protein [Gimesia fumaroli]QDV49120.1 Cupin domain protein [Gimesia fumaroli]
MSETTERAQHGTGFDCFEAGPMENWGQFQLSPPESPIPVRGKYFLKKYLNSEGLEMSINVLPPGAAMPFVHRHQENDEIYFILKGKGQFQAGAEVLNVSEGFFIRLSPEVPRVWRNHSEEPLYYLVIQYHSESRITGGISDGKRLKHPIAWKESPEDESTHGPETTFTE